MNVKNRTLAVAVAVALFAMGAQAANSAKDQRQNEYKATIAHADADYAAAKDACSSRQGNDKDVCLKQAKAEHVKAIADAKARLKSNDAVATARDEKLEASYKVAKEKCDALSGDAQDACVRDAKLKYHQ